MRYSKFCLLTTLIFLLSACSATAQKTSLNLDDPMAIYKAMSVKHDNFKKIINYEGPNIANNPRDLLFIRAWNYQKTNNLKFQIYVADSYEGNWRFYNSADDSDGNSLEIVQISRDVGSCRRIGYSHFCLHTESVGVNISRDYLKNTQDTGINFKLSGKAGERTLFLPGSYVKAMLLIDE